MLSMNSVMIGTMQPKVMRSFYENVFGKAPEMDDPANGFCGWMVGSGFIGVLEHSGMAGSAKDPGRVLINFETTQVQEEFERIKALGGAVIAVPYKIDDEWIATLADPDGNYFQLMNPFNM